MKFATNIQLSIPVDVKQFTKREHDETSFGHFNIDPSLLPQELFDFIEARGLCFSHWELFYTPPNRHLGIHIDGHGPSNIVKLNWVLGGAGSRMLWWKLKAGRSLKTKTTVIGTQYQFAEGKDCLPAGSIVIQQPTLVNVGQLHSVINKHEPRWCLSGVLGKNKGNIITSIEWDEAEAALGDLFI